MRAAWVTAPIWRDFPAVIVAGGASFTAKDARALGMARARDTIRVITVNDAVYPCWFADIAYAADAAWWVHHGTLPGFAGLKVSIGQPDVERVPRWVDYLRNTGIEGFNPDPDALRTGMNGGYQALHLVAHLGAKRVILVGFDNQGPHWFGEHPQPVQKSMPPAYGLRLGFFRALGVILAGRGIEIVNASAHSALDAFQQVDLQGELDSLETKPCTKNKRVNRSATIA